MTLSHEVFSSRLTPFLKWPGGKTSELGTIAKASPKGQIGRFIDPFVGGGSVFLAVNNEIPSEVNDICPELMNLYTGAASKNSQLRFQLDQIATTWSSLGEIEDDLSLVVQKLMRGETDNYSLVDCAQILTSKFMTGYGAEFTQGYVERLRQDLPKKIDRIAKLEKTHRRDLPAREYLANVLGSVRSTFYMQIRSRYNQARISKASNPTRDADFFFLREYAYASMFRFNAKGEFNIPYGGISYNKKDFHAKVKYLFSKELENRLQSAKFYNLDFDSFVDKIRPLKNDFIFIDPPYDSDFSDYDGRAFEATDQYRLADTLKKLDSRVMVVIGETPLIREVYSASDWNIQSEPVNYKWTIKSRNERRANHLIITNY